MPRWTGAKCSGVYKVLRARSYAGVVFTRFCGVFLRFCHVWKEFPRLRSRYVLVLLFPKQNELFLNNLWIRLYPSLPISILIVSKVALFGLLPPHSL